MEKEPTLIEQKFEDAVKNFRKDSNNIYSFKLWIWCEGD